jgi:hypothetical protein
MHKPLKDFKPTSQYVRVIRTLEYLGTPEWVAQTLAQSSVKGSTHAKDGVITEIGCAYVPIIVATQPERAAPQPSYLYALGVPSGVAGEYGLIAGPTESLEALLGSFAEYDNTLILRCQKATPETPSGPWEELYYWDKGTGHWEPSQK